MEAKKRDKRRGTRLVTRASAAWHSEHYGVSLSADCSSCFTTGTSSNISASEALMHHDIPCSEDSEEWSSDVLEDEDAEWPDMVQ